MMTPLRSRHLMAMAFVAMPVLAQAVDGSLLWKATSLTPATVVPAYTNQVSPFPTMAPPPEDKVDEEAENAALAEQQRLRDEAFNNAEQLFKSGRGFQPVLNGLRVGGMLEGTLGARVLLNNEWVGIGSGVNVRQARTKEMTQALTALTEYDSAAASTLADQVNEQLAGNGTVKLSVTRITARELTLTAPGGKTYSIPFSINNR